MTTTFAKNVPDLVSEALALCGDPNGERFSSAHMEKEVQSALIDVCEAGGFVVGTVTFPLVEGTLIYALPLTGADPIPIRVLDVKIPAENRVLLPMSSVEVDALGMLRSPGRVSHFCRDYAPYDTLWMIRCPDATEAGKTVSVRYMGVAAYPNDGIIDTRIPYLLHRAIALGAAARMLLTGDSTDAITALKHETEFRRLVRESTNPSTAREREMTPL